MAAGDELAGEGAAGEPAAPLLDASTLRPPAAVFFDGQTRDFPLGPDGRYVEIHPIDSRVQMALLVGLRGVASSTTTGNGLRGIEYIQPRRVRARATDAVRRALADMVAAGDITIERIDVEMRGRHAVMLEVDYFNERLPDRAPRTLTRPL